MPLLALLAAPLLAAPLLAAPLLGVWPLEPTPPVVAHFAPPSAPWSAGHRGVDLAGRPGQTVHAALPGTISFAGVIAGRGVVVVDHGPTRTTYEPVATSLARGSRVAAGTPIGRLELRGSHCPPRACLHWGWRRGEQYLDPLDLVGAAPVRLLPWAATTPSRPAPPPLARCQARGWAC